MVMSVKRSRAVLVHRAADPVTVPRALLNGRSFFVTVIGAHFVALHVKLLSAHGLVAI